MPTCVCQPVGSVTIGWHVGISMCVPCRIMPLRPAERSPHCGDLLLPMVAAPISVSRIFLLGMIDEFVHVALQGAIAASRVRVEPTAYIHRRIRKKGAVARHAPSPSRP